MSDNILNTLTIRIALDSLNNIRIIKEDIDGIEEEGIFIPIRFNPIFAKGHKYNLNFTAIPRKPNKEGYLYGLKPKFPEKARYKLEDIGIDTDFYCGNISNSKVQYKIYTKEKIDIEQALKNK